jgi:hypothetical protein
LNLCAVITIDCFIYSIKLTREKNMFNKDEHHNMFIQNYLYVPSPSYI